MSDGPGTYHRAKIDTTHLPSASLRLPPDLQSIFAQSYPRFSDPEYVRRHAGIARAMEAAGTDHLLIVTAQNIGNATRWMTGWPGTAEALLLFRPGEQMVMFVEYHNHLPLSRLMARDAEVRWGEENGLAKVAEELVRRGARRVGVIGPLSGPRWQALAAKFELVSLDADYIKLRLVKSAEEIAWLRIGAALSDAGMAALVSGTRPGMTEHELGDVIERAYISHGGTNVIHFIGSTPMAAPAVCVPPQFTSRRKIEAGDFVFCELSAAWWDYSGQVLRGFTVEAEPTSLYRDLHAAAYAAFQSITGAIRPGALPQSLIDASGIIEESGYTTYDDLVHGYGGGYLPPIIGSKSRPAGQMPTFPLEANMCLVVQPNVITPDMKAGVQFGELVRVTPTGFESLHRTPHGMFRAGQMI
ncbi:MAG TPA: M24 family metallopeptidase [Xanthobacteraceae bacterium]|nr:M24 family metallopeptidase [Xanthobacteraceae bacterium]